MLDRLDRYCFLHGIFRTTELGAGKDGTVYATSRGTAVKVHARIESYTRERDVYLRLRSHRIRKAWMFNVPRLKSYDDEGLILEMSIVTPPYLLDFAADALDAFAIITGFFGATGLGARPGGDERMIVAAGRGPIVNQEMTSP